MAISTLKVISLNFIPFVDILHSLNKGGSLSIIISVPAK